MRLHLRQGLWLGILTLSCVAWPAFAEETTQVDPAGFCECPDGWVPYDGACCPACVFAQPPCMLPCFLCGEECGQTGAVCDYSAGLSCCGGEQVCCPAGAQSTCSETACAR